LLKKAVLFFTLALAVSGALAAQVSGNEQRLVGTWTHMRNGSTVVFNANGTVSCSCSGFLSAYGLFHLNYERVRVVLSRWVAVGSLLVLYAPTDFPTGGTNVSREFRISGDGTTLIFRGVDGRIADAFMRS